MDSEGISSSSTGLACLSAAPPWHTVRGPVLARESVRPNAASTPSRLAHDLRNLLTAISGHLELAMLDLPATHPARRQLCLIEQAVRHGQNLADSLRSPEPAAGPSPAAQARRRIGGCVRKPGRGEPILLLEEDGYLRSIMTTALRAQGYAPAPVGDAAAALRTLNDPRAELRLMVWNTKTCGRGTAARIRAACRRQSDLAAILVTESGGSESAYPLGEREFVLPKPFATVQLTTLAARALAPRRTRG